MEPDDAARSGVACLMVVQRDDLDRFGFLRATFSNYPVEIIWDRRLSDRRRSTAAAPVEHRFGDRRHAPPASWNDLGFLVARGTGDLQTP
jgi:hypothetical protein